MTDKSNAPEHAESAALTPPPPSHALESASRDLSSPETNAKVFGAPRAPGSDAVNEREQKMFSGGSIDFANEKDPYQTAGDGTASAAGPPPPGGDRNISDATPPPPGGDRDISNATPPPPGGDRDISNATPPPPGGDRDISNATPPPPGGDRNISDATPPPPGGDTSSGGAMPKLDMPTTEEIREAPLADLQKSVDNNRQALYDHIGQNADKLPSSFAFHGGTKESNEAWQKSGGGSMDVPNSGGSGTPHTWVAGANVSPNNPEKYASAMAASFNMAAGYANPKHIKDFTAGGVAVIDMKNDAAQAASVRRPADLPPRDIVTDQKTVPPSAVRGLGNADPTYYGILDNPQKHFQEGTIKGIVDHSAYNANQKAMENSQPSSARAEIAESLRNQQYVHHAVKTLLDNKSLARPDEDQD